MLKGSYPKFIQDKLPFNSLALWHIYGHYKFGEGNSFNCDLKGYWIIMLKNHKTLKAVSAIYFVLIAARPSANTYRPSILIYDQSPAATQ